MHLLYMNPILNFFWLSNLIHVYAFKKYVQQLHNMDGKPINIIVQLFNSGVQL